MIRRGPYTRHGETRIVCGVRRVGQGRGPAAKTGRVWWRVNGGPERSSTVAEFAEWLTPPPVAVPDCDCDCGGAP